MSRGGPHRLLTPLVALIIGALFAFAVQPALRAFFAADDFVLLRFSVPDSLRAAARFFAADWGGHRGQGGYYRPVINLSLGIDRFLHGASPLGFRTTNLLAHLAASFALYRIALDGLAQPRRAAALAASLFLLHPFHDQAVLWVAGRTDVLCGLFYFLAFYFAIRKVKASGALSIAFLVLALLTKEMAVTFPLLLFCHTCLVGTGAGLARRAAGRALPYALVVLVFFAWRYWVLGGLGGDDAFLEVGFTTFKSAAKLLQWTFLPWDLDVVKRLLRPHPWLLDTVAVLTVGAVVAAFGLLRRSTNLVFALGWVFVTLLPVCTRPHAWYLYIPSAGACLWLGMATAALPPDRSALRLAASVLLVGAFAAGLYRNAGRLAEAASLARAATVDLRGCRSPCYVLNAPMALAGRYPILTGHQQYVAALAMTGSDVVPIPLNYVYVDSAAVAPSFHIAEAETTVTVSSDENTFFTLDEIAAPYRIDGINGQGKIDALSILMSAREVFDRGHGLAAYEGGRFRILTPAR